MVTRRDERTGDDSRPSNAASASTDAGEFCSPDVSFVIPAHNEGGYLHGTLASIARLDTDYARETIVVDGDSSDATRTIAREHGATVL